MARRPMLRLAHPQMNAAGTQFVRPYEWQGASPDRSVMQNTKDGNATKPWVLHKLSSHTTAPDIRGGGNIDPLERASHSLY